MARLNEMLKSVGFDLVGQLRDRLAAWEFPPALLRAHPVLVVVLPKQRRAGGDVETYEFWAFHFSGTIGELGVAVGILAPHGNSFGHVLSGNPDEQRIQETTVDVLNPIFPLSRRGAAILNGTEPNALKIVAVGLGALGSHVANNLVRAGFGIWTGVDHDLFLPHNAARHELEQGYVGRLKVEGMQIRLNAVLDEPAMPAILAANVLHPGEKEAELREALSNAEVIVDLSASLPVARKLAYHPQTGARRCSVFLNPSGSDLVLLCEDKARRVRLDWLEFQYYRELVGNVALGSHFQWEPGRIRYARSCRDLSSQVPQHLVAMHGGIASHALQQCLIRPDAVIRIWHADSSMNVEAHNVQASPVIDMEIHEWRVCTDEVFAGKLKKYRKAKLPKETGGILVGSLDQENRIAYLVDIIPSPPDSVEWPTLYIRGSHGLENVVTRVRERTDNQLQYLGEWHSHPDAYGTEPSADDKRVFGWLAEHTARDSNPPVMIIVGQKDIRIFVSSIDSWVLLKYGSKRK